MRLPPSVHVVLAPSRIAGASIGVLAVATVALILVMPLTTPWQILLIVGIVAWAGWSFRIDALHRGRFAVSELRLAPDLILVACMGDGRLVAGDTLFLEGCGRTDLPGADPDQMYESLTQRLAKIPDDTILYPGHLYSPEPSATMGETRERNYVFRIPSLDQWRRTMGVGY